SLLGTAVAVLTGVYAAAILAVVVLVVALGGWAWTNETEMSEEDTRPLGGLSFEAPGPASLGWWGALGTAAVLLVGMTTLAFSALFLQVNSSLWTPQGTVGQPLLAVGTLVLLLV